jgi:hypothetical protein
MKDTNIDEVIYARETAMRDAYANDLRRYRTTEYELSREKLPGITAAKRADLFTVDQHDVLRVWEFKIRASSDAIGQVLVYLALCRRHYGLNRIIRPVIAAAEFDPDVLYAIEALHLGIEVVRLPAAVLNAGKVPYHRPDPSMTLVTL